MGFTKSFVAFIAGAAAGAIAGILLAPDKGSATRQKLITKKDDLVDAVKTKMRRDNDINETGISESGAVGNDQSKQPSFGS